MLDLSFLKPIIHLKSVSSWKWTIRLSNGNGEIVLNELYKSIIFSHFFTNYRSSQIKFACRSLKGKMNYLPAFSLFHFLSDVPNKLLPLSNIFIICMTWNMQSHNFIEIFFGTFSICDNDVIVTLQDNSRFMTPKKNEKIKSQAKERKKLFWIAKERENDSKMNSVLKSLFF